MANPVKITYRACYSKESKTSKVLSNSIASYSRSLAALRNILGFINTHVRPVSKSVFNNFKLAKLPVVLTTPFSIYNAIENIKKIVSPKSSLKKRVFNAMKSVVNLSSVAASITTMTDILATANLLSSKIIAILPIFSYLGMGATTVGTFFSLKAITQSSITFHLLRTGLNAVQHRATEEEKIAEMIVLLDKIQKKNIDKIATKLKIGKEANLAHRIHQIRQSLLADTNKTQALQTSQELIKKLKSRSICMLAMNASKLVTSVAMLAGSVLSVTPLACFTVPLFAFGGIISFVNWHTEFFLINSNPFDPQSQNRALQCLDCIKAGAQSAKMYLQSRLNFANTAAAV